jgi:membrane AbrB-like protein
MRDGPDPDADRALTLFRWTATLAVGGVGGGLAQLIGAPLPWLLGAMLATGAAAAGGFRPMGGPPIFPMRLRMAFIPVVGVLIGAAARPEALAAAPGWWPAILGVFAFVAGAHLLNYALFRRLGGLSRATAFFSGMPGGLLESLELGEKAGADPRMLTALQFARIAVTVTVVPLILFVLSGRQVGSAAGQTVVASPMGPDDALVLLAAGVLGVWGARRVRLPAGQILGPVIVSVAAHLAGLTDAAPPAWLVAAAQLVIGVSLGQRFAGVPPRMLAQVMVLSSASVAGMLGLGALIAGAVGALAGTPFAVMLIGLSPGGVVEMGLIALSLSADPIFVTFLHLARIVATVALATLGWSALTRRWPDA